MNTIRSINTIIIIGISFALTCSFYGAGWYAIEANEAKLYRDFEDNRRRLTSQVGALMVDPLYFLSPNNAGVSIELVKLDQRIVSVEVFDTLNDMGFLEVKIPNRRLGNLFENNVEVVKDGVALGKVKIIFSDSILAHEVNEEKKLIQDVFSAAFLSCVLIMFPLLYIVIFRPLKRLAVQAGGLRANDLEHSFVWKGGDEISLVGRSLEFARLEIRKLVLGLRKKNKALGDMAETDKLTKLFNRHKLDSILEQECRRCSRYGTQFGIIIIDIDNFKLVNDTFGHQVGDDVLVAFADIIRRNVREVDIVARWGGEEFLVVCTEIDQAGAFNLAEKLRGSIAAYDFQSLKTVTASFGVSIFDGSGSLDKVMSRADAALYRAKEDGRNRVSV